MEYVVEKVPESEQVIYNSLLELYLRNEDRSMKSPEAKSLEKNDSEYVGKNASPLPEMAHPNHEKIMNILQFHSGKYNEEHCLVLMRLYKFEEGILYLYKKMKLFNEILQHYIQRNRTDKILQLCEEYEEDDPTLWIQALSYFSACAEEHPEEIRKILIRMFQRFSFR